MPWCDDCSKFWNSPQLATDGTCPTCGRALNGPVQPMGAPGAGPTSGRPEAEGAEVAAGEVEATALGYPGDEAPGDEVPGDEAPAGEDATAPAGYAKGAPWHFKLLVLGVTVYMIYRIYWLIEWLPKHI